jgi:prepilin signal peptidase PulO-like enzyme (type II secretory pathway)
MSAAGLATAFWLLALLRFGAGWRWLSLLPLLAALAVLVILDLRTRTIPYRITVPGIGYALLISVLPAPPSVPSRCCEPSWEAAACSWSRS